MELKHQHLIIILLILSALLFAEDSPEELILTNSKGWAPYLFTGEDGTPRGIIIDVWKEFEDLNEYLDFA